MGRVSAIVALTASVSAAAALASCRVGYELTDDNQLSSGSLGAATGSGTFGNTGAGGNPAGDAAANASASGGSNATGITEFSGLGGVTSTSSNGSGDGSGGDAGESAHSGGVDGTDGTDGTDTTDGTDGTDGQVITSGTGGSGATDGSDTTDGTDGTDGTDTTNGTGGSGGSGPVTPLEHCDELRKLDAPPVIDGELEPRMYLETPALVGWNGDLEGAPAGNSLSFSAAWYDTGLYFYIEVTDPERNPAPVSDHVWRGDSIEIYVDHDAVFAEPETYDNPGTFQFVVGAPETASDRATRADVYAVFDLDHAWPTSSWVSLPSENGYRVEAFVAAADLGLSSWTLAPDSTVGFDLGQNVSFPLGEAGDQENRAGQWFLKVRDPFTGDVTDYPYAASDVFCTPTLLGP